MLQPSNGQPPLLSAVRSQKRHNAKLIDGRKRQAIIIALANGESKRSIARRLNASQHTVAIISDQEWQQVAARKQRLAPQAERNALLAGEQITEALEQGKYAPSALVPVYGVSLDKALALRGDPSLTIDVKHRHEHSHSIQLQLLEQLKALNAQPREKPAQATVVKVPALPAKTGHHSEEKAAQKGR